MIENKVKRTLLILIAFLGSYFISYVMDPYASIWDGYFHRHLKELVLDWILTLAFCAVTTEITITVDKKFNRKIPWDVNPLKRLFTQSFIQVLCVVIINIALSNLFDLIFNFEDLDFSDEFKKGYWNWIIANVLIALMISGINTGNYLITNWKLIQMEAAEDKVRVAKAKQAAAEAELQALKLQLDNHFVFNNLSVLSELILKDQKLGYKYAENFAKVYRYLLVNSKINLISLKEELRFLDAYLFLIKNRLGEGVIFDIDIDQSKLQMSIPPITVQLLIENALKHNQTAKEKPLLLRVYTNSTNELVVENTIIPLINKADSAGIGLNNIINRYALISELKLEVKQSVHFFTVKVPLL